LVRTAVAKTTPLAASMAEFALAIAQDCLEVRGPVM
jgi:hypothetical protein